MAVLAALGVALGSTAATASSATDPVEPPSYTATEVESGVGLPKTLRVGEETLRLISCGTRDVMWADIYVAALYVPQTGLSAVGDPQAPMAVSLTVLDGSMLPADIPEQYREALQRTIPERVLNTVRQRFSELSAGDTVWLTAMPDGELVVSINGGVAARVQAHDVMQAILDAWSEEQDWQGKLHRMVSEHPC